MKPWPKKVQSILGLTPPINGRQPHRFFVVVQYYRNLWHKHSKKLAPLTALFVECGHIRQPKKSKRKCRPWKWDEIHQKAFTIIARYVTLAYPNYSKEFKVYTDGSKTQLSAVITQNNMSIALFSQKLTEIQQKYSVTKLELLAIGET
ncbi:hypothetical protein ACHAW6_003491 [Cyclotella cf. meneghiniana]